LGEGAGRRSETDSALSSARRVVQVDSDQPEKRYAMLPKIRNGDRFQKAKDVVAAKPKAAQVVRTDRVIPSVRRTLEQRSRT
jgi:hypothetical protein